MSKQMFIAGIDPSTRTGFAVLRVSPSGHYEVEDAAVVLSLAKGDRVGRAREIGRNVQGLCLGYKLNLAVVEGYGYANASTLAVLVEIGFMIRYLLSEINVPFIEVPPTSMKKFVCGSGAAKKNVLLLELYKRWGFLDVVDEDVGDAIGLALTGAGVLGCFPSMTEQQKSVVGVLRKSSASVLDKVCT